MSATPVFRVRLVTLELLAELRRQVLMLRMRIPSFIVQMHFCLSLFFDTKVLRRPAQVPPTFGFLLCTT
jgi:hypothetical protein